MNTNAAIPAGIPLVIAGIALILLGTISGDDIDIEGGGIVFIGPIPIVFGSNRQMIAASIVLGVVVLGLAILYWR